LLVQIADNRSLQAWPSYRLFESKFDRDSDFETPVAVFILKVELYAVTTGLTTVGGIEQPESINNALVDGVVDHLIVPVTEIENSLCGRGRPRGECSVFLRKDQSGGKHAHYENQDV
jgi:hypothetical protein